MPSPTTEIVGYARVSTDEQSLDLQLDALKAAGCDRVYQDVGSGTLADRPDLARALDHVRAGDTLVVWKLDRLGRSTHHLIGLVQELDRRGIALRVLDGAMTIDTSTPSGKLVFGLFALLAEFERDLLSERTRAGLAAARARGRKGGRPSTITPPTLKAARQLREGSDLSMEDIAKSLKVSRSALYRALAKAPR
ncbi:MAG: recombinase family protein [Solirubrobacteraceae bacterium]